MGIEGGQKKVGTNFLPDNRNDDKGSPQSDPISGEGRDRQTSTHYPFRTERITEDKGGSPNQEGQDRRGYVLNDAARLGGPVDDATVAPDGTNRVKKIG